MKTLYVHIGAPKTATTVIQNFCYDNRDVLEKHGYCYPVFPYKYPGKSNRRNGLFLTSPYLDKDGKHVPEEEEFRLRDGLGRLQKLFQKYDNIILSDEGIWENIGNRRKHVWKELREEGEKGGFQIIAIAYLRRQDDFVSAWWNQKIKKAFNPYKDMTWEEFRANIPKFLQLNYYKLLENMSADLGKENVIARRFDRASFHGGMIQADFLRLIGLELTDEYRNLTSLNLKLSGNTHEIKRILNTSFDLSERENKFFWDTLLDCSIPSGKAYPCSMLSLEETREFMEKYEKSNRKVAAEYLGEEGTPLFSDNYKDLPKWEKDNPYMQDDIIRFVGEACIHLMKENDELKREIEKLKKTSKGLIGIQKDVDDLKNKMKHPLGVVSSALKNKVKRS